MKLIRFDEGRMARNRVGQGWKPAAPIGVQEARDHAYEYFWSIEIEGESQVVFSTTRRTENGDSLRIRTNAPIKCFDADGVMVRYME